MQSYQPQHIYLDPTVKNERITKRILDYFPHLPVTEITDRREIKIPQDFTHAKKQLFISAHRGEVVKSCQGMVKDCVCCLYYTISLVSDCHLECTYCILQDYLKNNPVITINANVNEILDNVATRLKKNPNDIMRIGTGELSDSLALDHITGFSTDLIEFANQHKNVVIELKTKTNNIESLLKQKHNQNVVISWSLNPQKYIDKEEFKCSSLKERLAAARECANHGFPIGFHFDPLLYFDDWKEQYTEVIQEVARQFKPDELAWVSLGSLRFTPELKKMTQARFPKSKVMTGEIYPSADGKMRYFRPIREEMYKTISGLIQEYLPKAPYYLCMETKTVWNKVFGSLPANNRELEDHLTQRFAV